jgi:hypothetical protein
MRYASPVRWEGQAFFVPTPIVRPMLPESIPNVRIRGLQVGSAVVDLELTRDHETVGISQSRRIGEVQIIMVQ